MRFILKFLVIFGTLMFFYWSGRVYSAYHELDAGRPDLLPVSSPTQPQTLLTSQRDEVGVQPSSGQGAEDAASDGILGLSAESAGSSPDLAATLADYDDSFLATEEGLYEMTIGLWQQPEFLELTQDEAHRLLGTDDTMGMRGPETLFSIAGPLPTRDDCRIAMRSQDVVDSLRATVLLEVAIVELGDVPRHRRTEDAAEELASLIRLRDAAMLELCGRLEEATTYPSWTLWWRLYRSWSQ